MRAVFHQLGRQLDVVRQQLVEVGLTRAVVEQGHLAQVQAYQRVRPAPTRREL